MKACKRKSRGKSKAVIGNLINDEMESLKFGSREKLSLINELKGLKQQEIELQRLKVETKFLIMDISTMTPNQRLLYEKLIAKFYQSTRNLCINDIVMAVLYIYVLKFCKVMY